MENVTETYDKSKRIINASQIVNCLDENMMKQFIESKNGVKRLAKQYIQYDVAPNIPSTGFFILKNGNKVSAKEYIENYILKEGQEEYKGDIWTLLLENTKANDGTINLNGEQIDVSKTVNFLNPDLLSKKFILQDGSELSGIEYVQKFVNPNIPSNGKFILKSNNSEISVTQFIEDFILSDEAQEKYKGNINFILEHFTQANNGTIEIDEPINKFERSQAQEQVNELSKATEEQLTQKREFSESNINQKSSLSLRAIKNYISFEHPTPSVLEEGLQVISTDKKASRLMFEERKGTKLSKEDKTFLEEYKRQTFQNKMNYKKREEENKGMSLQI